MPISVEPKKDDTNVSSQAFIIKYNEDKARDVASHILIQYPDYTFNAQYKLFLTISGIGLSKTDFNYLCRSVREDLASKFVENNALMEYHVDHVMPREHTKMINILAEEVARYKIEWNKEAYKETPDISKLARLSGLMHRSMSMLSEFNLGTNVILFIQKKMELLENKSKTLNITDLNNANKYDDTEKIDNKVNDLSLPETATSTTSKAPENGQQDSNGATIPKVKRNESNDVQRGISSATKEGSGEAQGGITKRTAGAVF